MKAPVAAHPVVITLVLFIGLALMVALGLWVQSARRFRNSQSVAEAYDRWTNDALLERLWGDHVHLGHYGVPPRPRDFREAKVDFVHELVRWSGLDRLPPGSKVLDVGCGIGGSARILAQDYGFDVLAISISEAQIARARALTPPSRAPRGRVAGVGARQRGRGEGAVVAGGGVGAAPPHEIPQPRRG